MSESRAEIRTRILEIVQDKYGRAEEELTASGIIDSLSAVELALALEKELGLEPDCFSLKDMVTVTALTERVLEVRGE